MDTYDKTFLKKFLKVFGILSGVVLLVYLLYLGLEILFGNDVASTVMLIMVAVGAISFVISLPWGDM
jgi:hypothetical protein